MNKTLNNDCKAYIDIWSDYVFVFGQRINKPKNVSVIQWIKFWERAQKMQVNYE